MPFHTLAFQIRFARQAELPHEASRDKNAEQVHL